MKETQITLSQAHINIGNALADISDGIGLDNYSLTTFVDLWSSVAIIHGFSPSGHNDPDSGMPTYLRPIACEARRRLVAGLMDESEFAQFSAADAGAKFHLKTERRITHRRGFPQD